MLADTSLTGGDVTAVLAGLGETGRHCRGCLTNWRRAPLVLLLEVSCEDEGRKKKPQEIYYPPLNC